MRTRLSNKFFPKDRLFGFRMDKDKSLNYNIDRFEMVNAQLVNIDKLVDDIQKISYQIL